MENKALKAGKCKGAKKVREKTHSHGDRGAAPHCIVARHNPVPVAEGKTSTLIAEKDPKQMRNWNKGAAGKPKFMDLCFILATSNVCERQFSKAGCTLGDRCRTISPKNLKHNFIFISKVIIGALQMYML